MLQVTPGLALGVDVGGVGNNYAQSPSSAGGVNGGGAGSGEAGGGGGATDVTLSGTRVLVAGGGGGAGSGGNASDCDFSGGHSPAAGLGGNADSPGGAGGSDTGGPNGYALAGGGGGGAATSSMVGGAGVGGQPSTMTSPSCGSAGGGSGATVQGHPGVAGSGSQGGGGTAEAGGGGGGGYYGGGQGAGGASDSAGDSGARGGGGGGSSYAAPSITNYTLSDTGNSAQTVSSPGTAVISYTDPISITSPYTGSVVSGGSLTVADPGLVATGGAPQGDSLTAAITSQPAHGTLSGTDPAGGFTYTPTSGYTGSDTFGYQLTDPSGDYATATATITVQATQAITFSSTPPSPATVGGSYPVAATGGMSGNLVTFTLDPATTASACTLSGSTVILAHVGTCVIDANQAGTSTYAPAPQVQQSFPVTNGPLDHLTLTATASTTTAGSPVTYRAEGYDRSGNDLGDITAGTTFTLTHGSCAANSCASTTATPAGQPDTLTATDTGKSAIATLTVIPAPLAFITLATGPVGKAGSPVTATATGYDRYANPRDASPVTLAISPDGNCTALTCTPKTGGKHTITATVTLPGGARATATSTVSFGYLAPAITQTLLGTGDKKVSAAYRIAANGSTPVTITVTATARGHRTRVATLVLPAKTDGVTLTAVSTVTQLTDGIPYTVTIAVRTAGGTATTNLGTAIPSRVPGLTAALSHSAVGRGKPVTLTGILRNGGVAVPNRPVAIVETTGRTTRTVTVRTDRSGHYTLTLRPRATTVLTAVALFGPANRQTISQAPPRRVTVD